MGVPGTFQLEKSVMEPDCTPARMLHSSQAGAVPPLSCSIQKKMVKDLAEQAFATHEAAKDANFVPANLPVQPLTVKLPAWFRREPSSDPGKGGGLIGLGGVGLGMGMKVDTAGSCSRKPKERGKIAQDSLALERQETRVNMHDPTSPN